MPQTWDQAKVTCGNNKAVLATVYDKGIEDYLYCEFCEYYYKNAKSD